MARRSGLGKGLGALLPSTPTSDQSDSDSALREVDIDSIKVNPNQPRISFDPESLASLSASIKELGVLQPLLVREQADGYELIAGERRLRASQLAGLTTAPVIVRQVDDTGSLEQALVENLHRQDLNPLEEAAAYKQLIDDFHITHDAVATRMGKSRVAITNTLRLLQLPAPIQRMVVDNELSAGHARALLGTDDHAFADSLAKRAVKENLSVRAVEDAVRMRNELGSTVIDLTDSASNAVAKNSAGKLRPAALLELEQLLADFLDTRVAIDMGAKRGKVAIEFSTLDDLERIYKLMTAKKASV